MKFLFRNRYLVFIVALMMIISNTSSVAYAGKPGSISKVDITTLDFQKTLSSGEYFEFEVVAKYGSSKILEWSNSENLSLVSGPTVVKKQEKAVFRFSKTTPATYNEFVTVKDSYGYVDTLWATIIVEGNPPVNNPPKYVALGDSIPSGIYYTSLWNYLFGGTDSYSYVEQLADRLNIEPSNFVDASVSGYNTVDVFNQINTMTEAIRDADIITLCVGANDIMDAAGRDTSGLLKYSINWNTADSGRDNFEFYWWQLIDRIENLNSDVTLVVMTIYNPYRTSDSFYNEVDPYFSSSTGDLGLNYIIKNTPALYDSGANDIFADTFNYKVVDIYKAFNEYANKDSLTGFYSSFCDPHPNQTGQNLIFTEHQKVITIN